MKNCLDSIKKGEKKFVVGFTSVVGDMLHAGHALMLDECKMYCDYLYVGLIDDPTKDRPQKNKPIQSLFERYYQLASHRAVDEVIPLDGEADLDLAIRSLPIDVRFVGEDYVGKDFTGKDTCAELGIEIIYNRRKHNLSSTELRMRTWKGEEENEHSSREDRPEDNLQQEIQGM